MKDNRQIVSSAVAGILAFGTALTASQASAAGKDIPSTPTQWEKCLGVSVKELNDCGTPNESHGCGQQAMMDQDPNEWIWTPLGTCQKLGGKVWKVFAAKSGEEVKS